MQKYSKVFDENLQSSKPKFNNQIGPRFFLSEQKLEDYYIQAFKAFYDTLENQEDFNFQINEIVIDNCGKNQMELIKILMGRNNIRALSVSNF